MIRFFSIFVLAVVLMAGEVLSQEPEMDLNLTPEVVGGAPLPKQEIVQDDPLSAHLNFNLTDQKLRAFAEAAVTIQDINAKWDSLIAATQTDEEAMELTELAKEESLKFLEMVDAISADEYHQIFKAATVDEKLNRVTQAYMNVYRHDRLEGISIQLQRSGN